MSQFWVQLYAVPFLRVCTYCIYCMCVREKVWEFQYCLCSWCVCVCVWERERVTEQNWLQITVFSSSTHSLLFGGFFPLSFVNLNKHFLFIQHSYRSFFLFVHFFLHLVHLYLLLCHKLFSFFPSLSLPLSFSFLSFIPCSSISSPPPLPLPPGTSDNCYP